MKNVETTLLAYFIKCRKSFLYEDFVKRDDDAGELRILIPTRVLPLINDTPNILPLYLSGKPQRDMYMWQTMVEKNGNLSGFIQDLEITNEKALLFGDEHQIRFWEKEFIKTGIRVPRYDAGTRTHLSEKICYLSKNKLIPIDDELVCIN